MTTDQRAKLVALIYEYGEAVAHHASNAVSGTAAMDEVQAKVAEIRALLDEMTEN